MFKTIRVHYSGSVWNVALLSSSKQQQQQQKQQQQSQQQKLTVRN